MGPFITYFHSLCYHPQIHITCTLACFPRYPKTYLQFLQKPTRCGKGKIISLLHVIPLCWYNLCCDSDRKALPRCLEVHEDPGPGCCRPTHASPGCTFGVLSAHIALLTGQGGQSLAVAGSLQPCARPERLRRMPQCARTRMSCFWGYPSMSPKSVSPA